ncbi:MAG: DUF3108 domain-containing protein [Candidatus Marinimicrobia bacterium]|nr:DUF3108 domain-containing protein [Candidatus Neomarinimicrobiota bacterium]
MNRLSTMFGYRVFISLGIFFLTNPGSAQDYQIAIFSIPCASVEMNQSEPGKLNFRTKSIGIIDLIWPEDNRYTTHYDSVNFAVKSFEKQINQGNFSQKLNFTVDENTGVFRYNDETDVQRKPGTQTIFTLLARVSKETAAQLDTYWFPMEHEGQAYQMRLLWSDSTELKIGKNNYNCDHYRLDIEPTDDPPINIIDHSDYFSEYIVHPTAIRQLWVEKNGRRRIIMASVKLMGLTLEAKLLNE